MNNTLQQRKKRKCQWHYIMYFDMQITKITPFCCATHQFYINPFFQKGGQLNTKLEIVVFVLIVLHVTWLNLIFVALLWRRFVYQKYIVMEWRSVNDLDK